MNKQKLLRKVLASPNNVRFNEMVALVEAFGFQLQRVSGSHHVYEHPGVPQIVNLQERKGQAKAYQVRQFLELIEQHNLDLRD